jgi:hypothetical protein
MTSYWVPGPDRILAMFALTANRSAWTTCVDKRINIEKTKTHFFIFQYTPVTVASDGV